MIMRDFGDIVPNLVVGLRSWLSWIGLTYFDTCAQTTSLLDFVEAISEYLLDSLPRTNVSPHLSQPPNYIIILNKGTIFI